MAAYHQTINVPTNNGTIMLTNRATLLDTHWSKGRTVVQARWSSPWAKDTDPSAAPTTLMIPQANKPPSSTRDQLILPMTLFASTRALRCVRLRSPEQDQPPVVRSRV